MELLTKHLDIWTEAQVVKPKGGRGRGKKAADQSQYGIKKLRELILELAVRGKLLEQDPNDEPASVLLEKIAEEKARLIKEKKIKKQKKLPEIIEEEKPFELSEGWEWARLPDVCSYKPGKTPSTKNPVYWSEDENDMPWVSISDMEHFGRVSDTKKRITQAAIDQVFKYDVIPAGSLLMSFKLTLGKISILDNDAYHNEAIISIQPFSGIDKNYLFKFLPARALAGNTKNAIMGNTLNATSLALLLIPTPPEAEQQRIVAKVDELMALCDQLEQQQAGAKNTQQTLLTTLLTSLTTSANPTDFKQTWHLITQHFHTLFTTEDSINQLKQSILQLAVMGKLVPQDPKDEPASVLLEKIAKEKARLIKEKKIKKQKKLPEISEEEKPFSLPEGWEWVSLSHLGVFSGGKTPSKMKKIYWDGHIPWVTPKDMKVSNIYDSEDHVTQLAIDNGLALYEPEALLFVVRSGILRRSFPVAIGQVPCTVNQDLKVLSPYLKELSSYIHLMMRGFEQYILNNLTKTGMTVESIMFKEFSNHFFMIPPIVEQQRIIAEVDELLALCDQLQAKLTNQRTTTCHLTDALVSQSIKQEVTA